MSTYLICNREIEIVDGKERFKNDGKEHALPKFRVAKCTILEDKKTSEYEMIDNQYPSDYNDVIKALDNNSLATNLKGTSNMFFELYNDMLHSQERSDILVFIHGFANSFQDNLDHIAKLNAIFIKEGSPIKHIIYISWPTRGNKVLTYWDDQKDAEETGRVLARVYDKMYDFFIELFKIHKRENCNNKIHLAAHSMGNQVLQHMLENIPNRKIHTMFSEVLLLHSDVKDTVFEKGEAFTKLEKLAERTHLYIHKSDDALWISRFTKNLNKRLGKRGPRNRNILNSETYIVDTSNVKSVESLRQRLWDHWGYIESKPEINDIIEVLKGIDSEFISGRKKKGGEGNYYYL